MSRSFSLLICFAYAAALSGCGSSDGLPNVTLTFTSSANQAVVGDSLALTWSSTNATACSASGGWSGTKEASGTENITLGAVGATAFSISCRGDGDANSASLSIDVLPLLEISASGTGRLSTDEDVDATATIDGFTTNREPLAPLSYAIGEVPEFGSVVIDGLSLTYTPVADFNGADSFVIVASSEGTEAPLTFDVSVAAVDDPPSMVLSTEGLGLTNDLDLLFADPAFRVAVDVADIDTPVSSLTYSAKLNGANTVVERANGDAVVTLPANFIAGKTQLELTVSDGVNHVSQTIDFWGAEILTQNPDRARVTQLFGNVRLDARQIDHYVVLDDLTDQDIKTAVWEALAFFYDDFFVQGDERRKALIDSTFNLLVVDFPEGLEDPFIIETACNVSAPSSYCMSDVIPQVLSFLEGLALYDELTDVRIAADVFSLITGVPGDGVAVGRYTIQAMTSAIDAEGEIGPNQLLWTLKHELGHAFGWLGDHSTEVFAATDDAGEALNDLSTGWDTVDFLYSDITLSDAVLAVKWQHKYRDSNSIPGWNTVDDKTNEALGYWQGCYFHDLHCFRSSHNSVMNGQFTSDDDALAWLENRTASDAFNYDAVGNEAQFLRAIQLQGSQDVTLYLPLPGRDVMVLDHRVRLPSNLFAMEWFVDGEPVADLASAGIGYQAGGASDEFVARLTIPRKPSGSTTRIAYRIRDLSVDPVVTVEDDLDSFADVYLGRFSPEGGFYVCPESNTQWDGVAETYCHTTVEAYLSDGSLVTDVGSVDELTRRFEDVTHFIERSGLGVQIMVDWTYF